ncbi:MAG TPA: tryptophan 2,3-dioxygenase family protein [Solimonas sp.]|nr:tryptophan 2,3-dioxygenase family protein [Solimonas sp.]
MSDRSLTYSRYLRIEELLSLQQPLSEEHDETLFIIIHQVYELWFKQLLHELEGLQQALPDGDTPRVLAALKRMLTVLKTLVGQVDILETMTPLSFNAFRARLEASSGFQSAQFRAVEFALGYKRAEVLAAHPEGSHGRRLLQPWFERPGLFSLFLAYLGRGGHPIPDATDEAAVQELLITVYRQGGLAAQVCERLVDLDEGLQEWRYRHVKMVERTIGIKPGSGGSSGAEYLRNTLFRPFFPALWAIRARL